MGHKRGFPQGCPLSQVWLALHVCAWMARMEAIPVRPRSLADDISYVESEVDADATADEPEAERVRRTLLAMEIISDFGTKAGGRVQMLKCFIFASRDTTRAAARAMRFGPEQDPCPVKTSFRDLGAHFDVSQNATAATLNKRCDKVCYELRVATKLPLEHHTVCEP